MKIDVHAHVFPDKIAERASEGIEKFYNIHVKNDGTLSRLMEIADEGGIDKVVIHSPATTPHQVESINNFIYECTQEYPERVIGFMTMHPDYENINDEVERCIGLGLKGLKLHPDFQKFNIDDKKAYYIYESIAGRLPLLLHTGDYRYPYSKPARVVNILKDFPALTVIGAHFGGWSEWDDAAHVLKGKNVYVDTSSTMYRVPIKRINELIRIYGADHVMFGSDYPMWNSYDELQYIDRLDITEEERELIMHKNAERVLGI